MRNTSKILFSILFSLVLVACASGQKGGLYTLQFSETPLCTTNTKVISFAASSTEEARHILGVALEPGSDPDAHFSIISLEVVSSGEIFSSVAGKLSDVNIPAGSSFKITTGFTPRVAGGSSQAIMTVTVDEPTEAIYQVLLEGDITEGGDCASASLGGAVTYDGPQNLQITRLIGVSQKLLSDPLTTDEGQVAHPFEPVNLQFNFDLAGKTLLFPPITQEDNFLLPPSLNPNVADLISGDTLIWSDEAVTGTYDSNAGTLSIPDMIFHMQEQTGAFETDFTVSLSTGAVPLTLALPGDKLVKAGMNVFEEQLVGQGLWPDDGSEKAGTVIFVGVGVYSAEVTGSSTQFIKSMPNTQMAIQIEAKIVPSVTADLKISNL